MWEFKVIDLINHRNDLVGVLDFDKTLVDPKYGNLSLAIIHRLARSEKYGNRYKGLFREVLNKCETTREYDPLINGITQELHNFAVKTIDWHSATFGAVKETELDKPAKNFLKAVQKVPAVKFKIVTGCEEGATNSYFKNKIAEHIPNVKVEIKGTKIEPDGAGYFTGNTIGPIMNAEERVKETREFCFNKISVGVGDSKINDLPFLRYPTVSYLLRGPVTAYEIGHVNGNVEYIDRKDLHKKFKGFLNTDARDIPLPITNLNVITPLVRRG